MWAPWMKTTGSPEPDSSYSSVMPSTSARFMCRTSFLAEYTPVVLPQHPPTRPADCVPAEPTLAPSLQDPPAHPDSPPAAGVLSKDAAPQCRITPRRIAGGTTLRTLV